MNPEPRSEPKRESKGAQAPERPGALVVCGINHDTATLTEREPYQVGRRDMVPALRELRSLRGVQEGMILSTCNRFEAYMVLHPEEEAFPILREFFIRFRGLDPKPVRSLFYVRHGSTAARHLFRVTGGLDSMVLGEYQIQSQVKEAYSAACSVKAPGKVLHRLVHAAFRAGKAVRTHTAVGAGRMSVAGMAVGVLKERLSAEDPVLLVGVNENIRIVAEGLKAAGFENLRFANRTAYKAEKLALRYGGEGHGLDRLPGLLAGVRGLVSCTGAAECIIPAKLLEALAKKDRCPELCIDMAVPRDIERPGKRPVAEIGKRPGGGAGKRQGAGAGKRPGGAAFPATVIDLEDLKAFRKDQLKVREEDLPAAERLVEDMVATFQAWLEGAFDPGMGALIKEFDRIRRVRLEAALPVFRAEDREILEQFSRDLMQDLLRVPAQSFLDNPPPDPSHKER